MARALPASVLSLWMATAATAAIAQGVPGIPAAVPSREYITAKIADLRRIATPEGIESVEAVDIGGTRQWISIRGLNRANPVLLMIHGGPGSPLLAASWSFQKPWEDFFTVVQWDQRGVGKNYAGVDHDALAKTMTIERMVRDGEEMVQYLRKRLGKEKIVVLGFSWGTEIGTQIAQRHPEWLHAYVGVGQGVDIDAERYIHQRTLELAKQAGNAQAIAELEAMSPYPDPNDKALRKVIAVRKWARQFNGGWYGHPDFDLYFSLPGWGPEYTQQDVDNLFPGLQWSENALGAELMSGGGIKPPLDFRIPVVFIMGRYDLHTPYEPAKAYLERLRAPQKKLVTFERSSHFPMLEEPGRFLMVLVDDVLPLTGEAAVFARVD